MDVGHMMIQPAPIKLLQTQKGSCLCSAKLHSNVPPMDMDASLHLICKKPIQNLLVLLTDSLYDRAYIVQE